MSVLELLNTYWVMVTGIVIAFASLVRLFYDVSILKTDVGDLKHDLRDLKDNFEKYSHQTSADIAFIKGVLSPRKHPRYHKSNRKPLLLS